MMDYILLSFPFLLILGFPASEIFFYKFKKEIKLKFPQLWYEMWSSIYLSDYEPSYVERERDRLLKYRKSSNFITMRKYLKLNDQRITYLGNLLWVAEMVFIIGFFGTIFLIIYFGLFN